MLIHKTQLDAALASLRTDLEERFTAKLDAALSQLEEMSARLALIEQAIAASPPGPYARLQTTRLLNEGAKGVKSVSNG